MSTMYEYEFNDMITRYWALIFSSFMACTIDLYERRRDDGEDQDGDAGIAAIGEGILIPRP